MNLLWFLMGVMDLDLNSKVWFIPWVDAQLIRSGNITLQKPETLT